MLAHATTLICLHWLNTLRNLEGEGDKGKKDLLHESHVIMEYNIAQRWVWPKNKIWETILVFLKVEGGTWCLFCLKFVLPVATYGHNASRF